jgi:hypothetical protein
VFVSGILFDNVFVAKRGKTMSQTAVDEKILANPSAFFDTPMDVVRHADYSDADKHQILTCWKQQAEHLQIAAGEGMEGGEPSRIEDVVEALKLLPDHDSTCPPMGR